jgi:uncharacterized OsmC-like protein
VQHALQITQASLCPVWAMIKHHVEVITSFRIIMPEDAAAAQPVW